MSAPSLDLQPSLSADPRVHPGADRGTRFAPRALRASATTWLLVAFAGQALFAVYVLVLYGWSALQGKLERWDAVMEHGWVPGATLANLLLATHLLFAVVLLLAAPLQLWPRLRRRAPAMHRRIGRAYLLAASVAAVGGFTMMWTREVVGDLPQRLGMSLDALLVAAFALLAWRAARAGQFDAHRRWALRTFMAASAVWSFRVMLMLWLLAFGRPAGFDPETFTGPFLSVLAFADYLLPLALLELYFRVQRSRSPAASLAMSALVFVLAGATLVGSLAAAAGMWLPRL